MKNWVCIYTSSKSQDAEIIKALLTHNEINSVVVNKQDSFYRFGEYEVYVSRDDAVKARFVIDTNPSS